jgi:hypothetical protein
MESSEKISGKIAVELPITLQVYQSLTRFVDTNLKASCLTREDVMGHVLRIKLQGL